MIHPTLMGIDAATNTGWAVGDAGMWPRHSGHVRDRLKNLDDFSDMWVSKFESMVEQYVVQGIAIESPFVASFSDQYQIRKLYGLYAFAHFIAARHRIRIVSVTASKWRKIFIGRGQAPDPLPDGFPNSSAWWKFKAIEECTRREWEVRSADEAEACGILDWYIKDQNPSLRAQPPLPLAGFG